MARFSGFIVVLCAFMLFNSLKVEAYNNTVLDPKHLEDQVWAMVQNPHYGLHVFARGLNGSLYHKFQTGPIDRKAPIIAAPFSEWHCLTPNATLFFDTDPAAALNAKGQIELFARFRGFLDMWQVYQNDPTDPMSFSTAREGTCMCPAVSPDDCPWCLDCENRPECASKYWTDHAPFPTSSQSVIMDPDGRLVVYYRGFDGRMYSIKQAKPGDPSKYYGEALYDSTFE